MTAAEVVAAVAGAAVVAFAAAAWARRWFRVPAHGGVA